MLCPGSVNLGFTASTMSSFPMISNPRLWPWALRTYVFSDLLDISIQISQEALQAQNQRTRGTLLIVLPLLVKETALAPFIRWKTLLAYLPCFCFIFFYFTYFLVFFIGLHLQHMEVPGLGVESELHDKVTLKWNGLVEEMNECLKKKPMDHSLRMVWKVFLLHCWVWIKWPTWTFLKAMI